MDGIQRLLAIEEIRRLKARYFRAVDHKDERLLGEIMVDDVVLDFRGAASDPGGDANAVPGATGDVIRGREEAVAVMMGNLKDLVTAHFGGAGEIEIISETRAEAIWPMHDVLRFPAGAPFKEMVGYGFYQETYERIAGKWMLKTGRLTRLRVDITEATDMS